MKITGGAGYSADAIKVFEGINGTLLLAAVSLVIVLLILIYRSPIFLFVPLTAVIFAELLARSLGYGLSEIGVTINSQSSSIMSVLVLGAGTDYAADRREIPRGAAPPARPPRGDGRGDALGGPRGGGVRRHRDRRAALPDDRQGQRHLGMGPIVAMGVACAALSMLTLLPALLTICGRRAFWPFVPHSTEWMAREGVTAGRFRRRIVEGSRLGALLPVVGGALVVLLLLPLVILNALVTKLTRGLVPSLILGPLDRGLFKPYEVRRFRHEHIADETHGFWSKVGRGSRGSRRASRRRGRGAARLLHRPGVLLDRPHDERQLPDQGRGRGGPGPPGQELPRRSECADRRGRAEPRGRAEGQGRRRAGRRGRDGLRPRRAGRRGRAHPGDPRAAAVLDRGLRPDRPDTRRGTAPPRAHSSAGRARSSSTCARPRPGTRR